MNDRSVLVRCQFLYTSFLYTRLVFTRLVFTGWLLAGLLLSGCVTETTGSVWESDPKRELRARVDLGVGYLSTNEFGRAKENLVKALEIDPDSAEAHNAFGVLFKMEGEVELSEEHFKKALSSNRHFTQARNNYAAFLFEVGRYEDAVKQLRIASEDRLYQRRPQVFENLGVSLLHLNGIAEAEEAFMRSVQLNPKQPRALLELADIRFSQQNYVEARSYFRRHQGVAGQSSRSLWLCIQISRIFGAEDKEASCSLVLRNIFPASEEYKSYRLTLSYKQSSQTSQEES